MIHIDEYSKQSTLSRRQLERLINRGSIPSTKINGQRYIIVPPSVDVFNSSSQSPIDFKHEIRTYVKKAGKSYIPEALKRIEEFERVTGRKITGLSQRALYRIANEEQTVFHKKRSDTGGVKNPNMRASKEKIEAMAAAIYMQFGKKNKRFLTTRIQEIAASTESLYEIAAIPQPTLYRYIRSWIDANGYDGVWDYYNNHKAWLKTLPKITGAFTDDIEFMDYVAFDDRKADVAGSWYYNEITGKYELRKVWYWIAIEMLTMMPVGWVVLPREPNSDDVIQVLVQSMMQVGLPKKGYLFDNGIGTSEKVKKFITRIKTLSSGSDYFTRDYIPVAPYEPTHKSNIERFNRFIKDEHDVFFKNYVGGNRDEVRHSGKRLMPEECDHLVEEYVGTATAYLTGDCVNRMRDKVIHGKKYRASLKQLFDKHSESYEPYLISEQNMRWAMMDDDMIRTYKGKVSITREGVRFDYIDTDYNPALEGRDFIISMLQNDVSKMDLYATEDFTDTITGASYERGQYVSTLYSMRTLPAADVQKIAFKKRKQAGQHVRKSREKLLEFALAQFPELIPLVNTHITIDGAALEVRAQLLKRMDGITATTPAASIAAFIRENVASITENVTALTFETEPSGKEPESNSLTFTGEDI